MITIVILIVVFLFFFKLFSPKIEHVPQSKMWICYYDKGKRSNTRRDWFIIYKEK